MAITERVYNLSPFWNSDDLLNTLETALADVGFHAAAQTGTILTFTNTAGTTILGQKGRRYLVKQSATSGTGVYATFDVYRNQATGAISAITLVRGGNNYAASNTITINGADIGGTTPTDNVTITVSTVTGSQGTTTTWYDEEAASPYTWAVACVNMDETKKMGQTYYSFHLPANPTSTPTLYIRAGAGFNPSTNVFTGVAGLDYITANTPNSITQQNYSQVVAKTNATPLRLKTFQSGIDPNFVVFQFSDVDKYGDVFRPPFVLSKYNSATQPWSLDDCFTGGIYEIGKNIPWNTFEGAVDFRIATAPMGKRQGEWGYGTLPGTFANGGYLIGYYESVHGKRFNTGTARLNQIYPGIYQRTDLDLVHTPLEYNPVITGLPICNVMLPVPYYIPADFGITEVVGTNTTSFRDEIKVGATTTWKVLQYANNHNNILYNSSVAFVAKIVD